MLLSEKRKKPAKKTPLQCLQYLIDEYGGIRNVARAFCVAPQTVCQWMKSGRIPAARVIKAYELSESKITMNEFRPDIFPKGM